MKCINLNYDNLLYNIYMVYLDLNWNQEKILRLTLTVG